MKKLNSFMAALLSFIILITSMGCIPAYAAEDESSYSVDIDENEDISETTVPTETVADTVISGSASELTTSEISDYTPEISDYNVGISLTATDTNNIYVSSNGDSANNGLSESQALKYIDEAITLAEELHSQNGYDVNIYLCGDKAIFATSGVKELIFDDYMTVYNNSSGLSLSYDVDNIENLNIYDLTKSDSYALSLPDGTLSNCNFHDYSKCLSGAGLTLENCSFYSCGDAISLSSVSRHLVCTACKFYNCTNGIRINGYYGSSSAFFVDNLTDCGFYSCSCGIYVSSVNKGTYKILDKVEGCTFDGCTSGLYIVPSSMSSGILGIYTLIKDCNFSNCSYGINESAAFYKDEETSGYIGSIEGCTFTSVKEQGIDNYGLIKSISGCEFNMCKYGLSSSGVIDNISVTRYNHNDYGIYLSGSHEITISSITNNDNTLYDIYVSSGNLRLSRDNVMTFSKGIFLSDDEHITLLKSIEDVDSIIPVTVRYPEKQPVIVVSSESYKVTVGDMEQFVQSHGSDYRLKYVSGTDPYVQLETTLWQVAFWYNYGEEESERYMGYYPNGTLLGNILDENNLRNPTRSWYTFEGWYTTSNCAKATKVNDNTVINSHMTLYANWIQGYAVNFYKNDGTDTLVETKYVFQDEPYIENGLMPKPARASYTFDGWYTTKACTPGTEFDEDYIISSPIDVYAKWSVTKYSVTFYKNDGTEEIFETLYGNMNGFEMPEVIPERNGYAFKGWYYDAACTDKVDEEALHPVNAPLSIYAGWDKTVFNVTFYLNDGTDTVFDRQPGGSEGFYLPSSTPARTGYRFVGWYYDTAFTRKVITEDNNHVTDAVTADLSIYAKWSADPVLSVTKTVDKSTARSGDTLIYTITVTNNGGEAKDVKVEDVLPSQLNYISDNSSGKHSNGVVTWTFGTLAEHNSKVITLTTTIK